MWKYFKDNEKVIMVVLLLLLAPTFAFTMAIQSFFTQADGDVYRVSGVTYSAQEWSELKARVGGMIRISAARFGRTFNGVAGDEESLNHLLYRNEAERLGLTVSDKELTESAKEAAKDLICWTEVRDTAGLGVNPTAKFRELRENVVFTQKGYQRALRETGVRMTAKQFEESLRELILVNKVRRMVEDSTQVPESEVWKEYDRANQRRIFEYIPLPNADFVDAAKEVAKADDERLLEYYYDNPNKFRVDAQVDLQCFKVDRAKLQQARPLTDAEVLDRYRKDRELYRNPKYVRPAEEETGDGAGDEAATTQPATEDGEDGTEETSAPDEPEYFPFEQKRDDVVARILQERERVILDKIIAAGLTLEKPESGLADIDLEQVVGEDAAFVQVIRTGKYDRRTIGQVSESVRSYAPFRRVLREFDEGRMAVGDFAAEPTLAYDKSGTFAYRVASYEPARTPEFDECRDKVIEEGGKEFAKDLAGETLAEWKRQIEAGTKTFEEIAKENNREIRTGTPVKAREWGLFKHEGKAVRGDRDIVTAGFALENVGDIADPVVPARSANVYLVRLKEILPADSTDWELQKENLRLTLEYELRQEAQLAFTEKLKERAEVTPLWDQPTESATTEPGS